MGAQERMTREFGVFRRRLLFEEDENREEENLRRAPVERGLREGKKKKNSTFRSNSIPNINRRTQLPIIGIFL